MGPCSCQLKKEYKDSLSHFYTLARVRNNKFQCNKKGHRRSTVFSRDVQKNAEARSTEAISGNGGDDRVYYRSYCICLAIGYRRANLLKISPSTPVTEKVAILKRIKKKIKFNKIIVSIRWIHISNMTVKHCYSLIDINIESNVFFE